MTDWPLISMIVPVYRAEKYLARCVDSLLAQTYPNFEILLVDDGSPDGCPALCDAFAAKDPRVRVLHTANGGVSVARNLGAEAARGAYIAFVDADDYIDGQMLTRLYEALTEYDAGLAVGGVRFVDEAGKRLPPYPERARCVMGPLEALEAMLYQTVFYTSPWGKLLPAQLVRAFPFPPGKRYEDMATTYLWLANTARIAVDTAPHYAYVQHAESFMGRAFNEERFVQLDTIDTVYAYVKERFPSALPAARARRFSVYCQILLLTPADKTLYAAERRRMCDCLRQDAAPVMHDCRCRKKDRVAAAAFLFGGERGLRLLWRVGRGA